MGAMKLVEGQAIELEDGTMAYVQNTPKRKCTGMILARECQTVLLKPTILIECVSCWARMEITKHVLNMNTISGAVSIHFNAVQWVPLNSACV